MHDIIIGTKLVLSLIELDKLYKESFTKSKFLFFLKLVKRVSCSSDDFISISKVE